VRRRANPQGVADRAPDPDPDRERQEHETECGARQERQLGELLGDPHLEWVHRTERRANRSGANTHRHRGERVEADAAGQHEQHGDQRDDLLLHVLQRSRGRERDAHHGNDERFASLELPGEPIDPVPQGAGLVHDGESATRDEHEADDRHGVGYAFGDCDERLERTDRGAGHGVIGARNHDPPAGRRVFATLELPRGEDVGQGRRDEDARDEQGQRVRKPEARHGPQT